jgi:hypothetical protein
MYVHLLQGRCYPHLGPFILLIQTPETGLTTAPFHFGFLELEQPSALVTTWLLDRCHV